MVVTAGKNNKVLFSITGNYAVYAFLTKLALGKEKDEPYLQEMEFGWLDAPGAVDRLTTNKGGDARAAAINISKEFILLQKIPADFMRIKQFLLPNIGQLLLIVNCSIFFLKT